MHQKQKRSGVGRLTGGMPGTLVVLFAVLIVGSLMAGCGGGAGTGGAGADASAESEDSVMTLGARDVAVAERGTLSTGIAVTGTLRPYRIVNVQALVSGIVANVQVDAGERVQRGEQMATIQAEGIRSRVSQAQSAVAAAEAQVAVARQQMESSKVLYEAGALSETEYENAVASFEAAQSQLAAAKAQRAGAEEEASRTIINAPLTGAVSERAVESGESVSPGTSLFTVVNSDYLELAAQMPISRAPDVAVGQPVIFSMGAYPERTFRGVVDRISPTANPQSRQLGIYLRLPNQDHDLVGGLFATGRILLEELEDALLVPESAVRGAEEETYVYAVQDGRIARRSIQVAGRNEGQGQVAVASGLSEGTRVLTVPGTDTITEGTRVALSAGTTTSGDSSPDGDTAAMQ